MLKEKLTCLEWDCFLAHQDINEGEDYIQAIESNLRDCDLFLYVGSLAAHNSCFCQQEIGMAKGLEKKIILLMHKDANPPDGFMGHIHAHRYREIDDNFITEVFERLFERLPPEKNIQTHLDRLGINCFSLSQKANALELKETNWDDHGFKTHFTLKLDGKDIGSVRIAFRGQITRSHTADEMPTLFYKLPEKFFSKIHFSSDDYENLKPDEIDKQKQDAIRFLLNDICLKTEEEMSDISNEDVLKQSLNRRY